MAAGYFGPGSPGFGSPPPDLSFKVDKDLQITYTRNPVLDIPKPIIPKPPTIIKANIQPENNSINISTNMLLYGSIGLLIFVILIK